MSIKKDIKNILDSGRPIDIDALYENVKDYDYVSFDIFDTLVKRNVEQPTDIFSILEKIIGSGFKDKRIEAEERARIESGKKEITIEDIYSFFPDAERQRLKTQELDIELKAIVPNQPIAAVFHRCIEAGKTVFITSDMYWSEENVRALLKKNGFNGYKKLYLSSKEQLVKSDGTLFRELLDQEKISPEQLIHIGDSLKSDYTEPKKLGIKAVKIPRYFKNVGFRGEDENDSIEVNYLNHFINNSIPYTKDPYYQFGYSQFGKLLFGFVHWIHDEAVKRGIKKVFFLARDGYIMKKAYELCVTDTEIDIKYLEVSRRSLRGPVLWMDCSYEIILKMVVNAKLVSLTSVFDGLGLEINSYTDQIKRYGLESDEIFDRSAIKNDDRLRKLIENIQPDIIENSKREYELLKRYLAKNDVEGRFAVVDIGYGGSMQRYLQQVLGQLGIEHDVIGLYLAVADFYTKNMLSGVKLDLNGYLFDFQHDKNAVDTRSSFVGLFESLFLEQGGSVKRYIEEGESVKAERYPYEYEIRGKATKDLIIIRRIQSGALDFVKRAADDELLTKLKCNPHDYFYGLHEVGVNPTLSDLRFLGDLSFYDEGITQKLAAPKGIARYALHPTEMKNDFLQCRWKTGFLKRLFKVKLPYQKLYERLRRMG